MKNNDDDDDDDDAMVFRLSFEFWNIPASSKLRHHFSNTLNLLLTIIINIMSVCLNVALSKCRTV